MATSKRSKKNQTQRFKSRKIIESFYEKHFTLLSYLRKLSKAIRLVQDGDPKEYQALLKSTLVAVPRDQSATPPFNPKNTQWFTLKEIINRVIEHLCRANKTNVLSHGFECLSGYGKKGTVAGTVGIQNSYPNTIVSYLRTAKAWQVLHQRIGDDLMIHLLQNMSLFVKVNSKCYFQLAGFPLSRLSPLSATDVSPTVSKSKKRIPPVGDRDGDGENSILKRKTRRGGKRTRRYRENSNQSNQEEKENLPGESDEVHRYGVAVHGSDIVTSISASSPVVSTKSVLIDGDNRDLEETKEVPQIGKRKRRLESSDGIQEQQPSAKKARATSNVDGVLSSSFLVETTNNDQRNTPMCSKADKPPSQVSPLLFPDESSQSSEKSSEEETFLCERASESCPCDNFSTSLFQEDTEANDICECSEKEEIRPVISVKEIVQSVLKRKKSVSGHNPWEYLVKCLPNSEQVRSKPKARGVRKTKENNKRQPVKKRSRPMAKIKLKICLNEVTLPRSSLFYSSNLSQTFPKNHIMETSSVSMAGARRLAQHIFLQESCLAASRNGGGVMGSEKKGDQTVKNVATASTSQGVSKTGTPAPKKQKPFRLPKKIKRVLPLLLKFLARHKKCPFRTLLRHHCYYSENRAKKGKKIRTLQRIPYRVKMMYHKRSGKRGKKSSKRARCKTKCTKVDTLMYQHAVRNYTKHDQVSVHWECVYLTCSVIFNQLRETKIVLTE